MRIHRNEISRSQSIEKVIKKIPKQRIFSVESICPNYPINATRRVLSKLIKNKEIGTISHRLYFRPGKSQYLPGCLIPPGAHEIVKAISKKTGEIISIHAAVALNQIGLSTQVPVREIFHTTGRSRYIKVNGQNRIKLVHINPKKLIMPGTVTCHVVTALWSQSKKYLTPLVIKRIHSRIKDKYFIEVLNNINKMPRWMGSVFLRYKAMNPDDPELQEDPDYWQG